MADSTVQIKLVTTADTSGADKTTDAVKKVEQATKAANSADAQRSANAAAAAASLNTLSGAQEKAAGSGKNMGNALLQGSRALQDMQYGLAGAVNNLEGIASALGLGAGVAGIVTVLAVTLQQLGPQIEKFFDSLSTDKIKTEGLKAYLEQIGDLSGGVDRAGIASERFATKLAVEDAALKVQSATLKENLALFNLRNAAALGQAEFEAQQKIEDIKAQSLPKEQEASEIAKVKLELLERQAALQKEASDTAIVAAQEDAALAAEAAGKAQAEAERLEEIIQRTERLKQLKEEEVRLMKEYAAAQEAAYDRELGQQESPQTEALAKQIEQNRAGQAEANRGGLADASTPEIARKAREDAERKSRAAGDAGMAVGTQVRKAEEQANIDAQRREQERQRIAREAKPGVYDPRNVVAQPGADPLTGQRPLPTAPVPGLPQPIMQQPANPLTGQQPLPGPSNLSAPPPSPLGGAEPLPQLDVQPLEDVRQSNEQANEAVLAFAQSVAAKNEELTRKLAELEAKMKGSRS